MPTKSIIDVETISSIEDDFLFVATQGDRVRRVNLEKILTALKDHGFEAGGLTFNGGYKDKNGYLHLTITNADGVPEDIDGFTPFFIGGDEVGSCGTADDALFLLAEMDIVSPMIDADGAILTDYNGNILSL
ncbi:MAG: hypothetical protein ACI4OB_07070 [Christensenellales bacterium]